MARKALLCLLFLGALFVTGCTGGTFATTSQTQSSTITSVSISCVPASVQPGQTSQCSSTVVGTGAFSAGVTWSALSGTITNAGLYTAPSATPRSEEHTSELQSLRHLV